MTSHKKTYLYKAFSQEFFDQAYTLLLVLVLLTLFIQVSNFLGFAVAVIMIITACYRLTNTFVSWENLNKLDPGPYESDD